MIKFICIEILTIVLVSIICFYINIKDKKIKKCKLEKLSLLIYSLVLGVLWIILLNTSIYFFKYNKMKFIVFGVLGLILLFILNEILKRIKLRYLYRNKEYNINIIIVIEILVLKIYPTFKRIKRAFFRISKELISLIPVIIIEMLFIYCFSLFTSIEDKEWDIFELVLTTIIITAYINIYNSERERRNKLKWQYKYCYFVENNMYDYIEKIMILVGITKEEKYKILDYLAFPEAIITEIKEYNTTERYKQFINKNINNTEKIQKYIEEITETFVNNLKENRNELIFIKENNNNEDYLYHNCIYTANNIKRNILLADIYKIGDTILIMLPDLIYYCSHILKLINSIWDEDDVYTERINSILEELKF